MRLLLIVFMLLFSLVGFGCAKQHPLVLNLERELIPSKVDGTHYSIEDVQVGILAACREKGWSAGLVEPGMIEASITVRSRHKAKIDIQFSATHYSLKYKESYGLVYQDGRIHSNYNHWVAQLDAEIKREFGLITQRF